MSKSVFNKSCAAVGVVRRGGSVCASMLVCAYAPQCVRVCESDREGERER